MWANKHSRAFKCLDAFFLFVCLFSLKCVWVSLSRSAISVTDLFMRKLNTHINTSVYLYCCCYWRSASHKDGQELPSDTVYLFILYWSACSLAAIEASSNIFLVKCTIISLLKRLRSVYGQQNDVVIVGKQINLTEKRWQRGFIVGLVSWGFQDKKQTTVSLHLAQILAETKNDVTIPTSAWGRSKWFWPFPKVHFHVVSSWRSSELWF